MTAVFPDACFLPTDAQLKELCHDLAAVRGKIEQTACIITSCTNQQAATSHNFEKQETTLISEIYLREKAMTPDGGGFFYEQPLHSPRDTFADGIDPVKRQNDARNAELMMVLGVIVAVALVAWCLALLHRHRRSIVQRAQTVASSPAAHGVARDARLAVAVAVGVLLALLAWSALR